MSKRVALRFTDALGDPNISVQTDGEELADDGQSSVRITANGSDFYLDPRDVGLFCAKLLKVAAGAL